MPSVFVRYPQLLTLRGKVPDAIIEAEVGEKAPRFEEYAAKAREIIPLARLCDVFPTELESGRIMLENFLGFWGNITIEEVCKIALIAAWLKPRQVFEFGTYNGMTTRQIALNTPADCTITTMDVDPASPQVAQLDIGAVDRHLAQKIGAFNVRVGAYFARTAEAARIRQILGDSLTLDAEPYRGQMDLVFIDAGHTYRYVNSDTKNALNMIRPGGVILWHDYMQVLHPDVTQYLVQLAKEGLKIYHLRGTSLAVCCAASVRTHD